MSWQYDNYIDQHCDNVLKGFDWLKENLSELFVNYNIGEIEWTIWAHDESKKSSEEYDAYDKYFYGNNKSYAVVQDFNRAWLHHIHNNPHHWQYWILINDDPDSGSIVLDMPYKYIVEMICDWWAFSWTKGNLYEIFDWYDGRKHYIQLSPKTRKTVESILDKIRAKLDEDKAAS